MNYLYDLPTPTSNHYLNKYIRFISSINNPNNSITENHHILPKSMGGSDHSSNLISLTPRQHYLAHWMLWKAYKNKEMTVAFFSMSNRSNQYRKKDFVPNSRIYEKVRIDFLKEMSTSSKKLWGDLDYREKHRITNSTEKTHQLRSNKAKELWKDPEYREKMIASRKNAWAEGRVNRDHSKCGKKGSLNVSKRLEVRLKNTGDNHYSRRAGYVRPSCPHCGKVSTPSNIKRWHGENCKKLND